MDKGDVDDEVGDDDIILPSSSNRIMEREGLLNECQRRNNVEEEEDTEDEDIPSNDMTSPIRTLNDVLREAEGIFTDNDKGWKEADKNEEIIVDEVDLEYSPQKKNEQPIEIIVRYNKVVATNIDSDSDDCEGRNDRGRKRFEKIDEGVELPSSSTNNKVLHKRGFRKGHRRAWSMPNAKGEQTHIDVIRDDKLMDGLHKRRIVRYRLHPYKKGINRAVGGCDKGDIIGIGDRNKVTFDEITNVNDDEDEDNELEVEINEEEIVYPSEEGGKGRRTVVKRFWEARWKAQNFDLLPEWLQDNEFLRTGHRPPLPSFGSCFKSIFALHTETGNIWTHMYGCVLFVGVALWFLTRPFLLVPWQEKLVFSAFFFGAVCCLGMSFAFHTVQCHSPQVGSLFSKLDYTGISMLIMGSFVPWIHYGFYCKPSCQIIYIGMIVLLGTSAMIVSLWDKFAEPKFRPIRAGTFVAMGLSSVVPAFHLMIVDGIPWMMEHTSLGWLLLMGALYLIGAALYATRVPERFFPGKCDLWFQSHQLFHTFVVIAALVHLHGICKMSMNTLEEGSCPEQLLHRYGSETNPSWISTLFGLDESIDIISWNPSMIQPL